MSPDARIQIPDTLIIIWNLASGIWILASVLIRLGKPPAGTHIVR
jgi:hypothetical protein